MNITLEIKDGILWIIYIIIGGLGVATARQLVFNNIKPFFEWFGISLIVSFSTVWILEYLKINVIDLKTLSAIFGWGFMFQIIFYYANLEKTIKGIVSKIPFLGGIVKWKEEKA